MNFVDMMNDKAKELGMNDTLYANSTGLPANNQYSTAYDTSLLLNQVSKYQLYLEDSKIWMDKLVHPSGRETELVNTNRLIKYYPNCISGKTGFTDEAGYCLSSTAIKNDMKLTCVVLGCDTMANRFKESIELYNYAYANFTNKKIVDCSKPIENSIIITGGKGDVVSIKPERFFVANASSRCSTVILNFLIMSIYSKMLLKSFDSFSFENTSHKSTNCFLKSFIEFQGSRGHDSSLSNRPPCNLILY